MLKNGKFNKPFKIAVCFFMMTIAIFLFANFALAANFWGNDTNGANFQATTGLGGGDLRVIIAQIIRLVLSFLGIIAVILIIYGGFIWMTSGGEEQKIEQAKQILKNAVIGLIIILLAFAIVSFILNLLTGGTGGVNNQPGTGPGNIGIGALGGGIIESTYPARDQKDVPRNTSIIVTFREAIDPTTICSNPTDVNKCNGEEINTVALKNIRIFQLAQHTDCTSSAIGSGCNLAQAKTYSTPNKKTFVFIPTTYLGSPSEPMDYAVYLTTGIKKADGKDAFAGSFNQGYEWSFEVSTKIDLTPPQVVSGGVFPAPDVSQDNYTVGAAEAATGSILVNGPLKVKVDAIVTGTMRDAGRPAHATINTKCQQDGTFKISLLNSAPLVAQLFSPPSPGKPLGDLLGPGTFGQDKKTITFDECNLVLTLNGNTEIDIFSPGNGWRITLARAITADTLTVGDTVYTFVTAITGGQQIMLGTGNAQTATNIKDALNSGSNVTASLLAGSIINLTAKVAGVAGNNINLATSNTDALVITSMDHGSDRPETVTAIGRRDKPMNATIQIDFNEAIMPLQVSGTADEVHNFIRVVNASSTAQNIGGTCSMDATCKSFTCTNGKCAGGTDYYLKGKFEISNQYSTVGFVSDRECGFNSCGEKIYCLPENSQLRVDLKAVDLASCNSDADCVSRTPFNTCDPAKKVCADINNKNYSLNSCTTDADCASKSPYNICDPAKKVCAETGNYPQADLLNLLDPAKGGIMDVALNSLDGNRNTFSEGPLSYYNENSLYGLCASGDNKNRQCSDADKVSTCGAGILCNPVPPATEVKTSTKAQENGDNYQWLFFINDQLDLTSPKIKSTVPTTRASGVSQSQVASTSFDKLMMSSRLTTGSISITDNKGDKIIHQLINLKAAATEPLAYWVTNEGVDVAPLDGEYEESMVYINHSSFNTSSSYTAQIGSGLKDVYQNCYLPSASLDCAATLIGTPAEPSCCNGVKTAGTSCP